MPKSLPSLGAAALAARRRVARWFGRERDPFADSVPGMALSPSERHFADYEAAPLTLRFPDRPDRDVAAWQAQARRKLAELAGYQRGDLVPPAIHDSTTALPGGGTRRRIYLRARRGVDLPIHIIAPKAPTRSAPSGLMPVMICLQGTNSGAHLSWGEVRMPADAEAKGYDFALQAAARGYIAVALEQSCFGERAERSISPRSEAPCVDATMHALLLGRSLLGERAADVSALVDWLIAESAALGADSARIHVMGHSAGGSVALFAAALDERIGAVLACGCIGPIRDTIGRRRDNQGQNVIPGILQWLELADVIGLVAPRPFATVAGEDDPIWPASGARAAIEEARAVYVALGASSRLRVESAPGAHFFRPDESWKALAAAMAG